MASSDTHTARIIPISRKDYCTCTRLDRCNRRMHFSNDTSKFMAYDCRISWKAEHLTHIVNSRIEPNNHESILTGPYAHSPRSEPQIPHHAGAILTCPSSRGANST